MFKKLVLVLLVAAVAGLSVYLLTRERIYSTSSSKALDYYKQGVESLMKFYFEEGRNFMELAVQEDPDFPLPYLFLLRMDFGDQTREQRTAWYKRLANPEERWTPFERQLIELATGKVESENQDAVKQKLGQFLREYSSQMEAFYLLLPMYQQLEEDPEKLVAYYEKLHQLFPNNVQILNQLGYFYVGLGEEEKARSAFEKYIFIRPDEANPYDSYGEMLYNTGHFQQSQEMFQKALDRKSDFVLSALHLSQAFMRQGKIRESNATLDELEKQNTQLKQVPDTVEYYRYLNYLMINDQESATRLLERLEQMNVMDSIRYQIRIIDCFNRSDLECVSDILSKLEEKKGSGMRGDMVVQRARYLNETGAFQESIDLLQGIHQSRLNSHFDIRLYVYYILIDNYLHLENRTEAETLAADLPDGYREYELMRIAAKYEDMDAAARYASKVLEHFSTADPDFVIVVEAKKYAESGHHDQDPQARQAIRWFDGSAAGPHCGYAGAGKG